MFSDTRQKLDELMRLYDIIKNTTEARGATLEQALDVSQKFWDNLTGLMGTLRELQESITDPDIVGVDSNTITEQKESIDVSGFCTN